MIYARTVRRAALLLLFLAAPALAQDKKKQPKVDPVKVDGAIRKGVQYLKGAAGGETVGPELVLLALVHSGLDIVPEGDPAFQTLLKGMTQGPLSRTYNVAIQAMILEEVDRVKHQRRIAQCAQFLVDNERDGYWGYGEASPFVEDVPTAAGPKAVATGGKAPKAAPRKDPSLLPGTRQKPPVAQKLRIIKRREGSPSDNSNSQYAMLGLRACHDAGILLPPEVIDRAEKYWREMQKAPAKNATGYPARGWNYKWTEPYDPWGSMTAGAVGGLIICDYIKSGPLSWKVDRNVLQGLQWLAENFAVTENPGFTMPGKAAQTGHGWFFYYLYALERVGILYGTETLGGHEWYPEGAKVLLGAQNPDGSWGHVCDGEYPQYCSKVWNTSFAILFLRRATRPLLDVASVDRLAERK